MLRIETVSWGCQHLSEYDCQTQEFILKEALRSDLCSLAWRQHM